VIEGVTFVDGLWIRGDDTTDRAVLDEMASDVYRLDTVDLGGAVVVDLGGNIGAVTRACLDRGAARVVVVEPDPQNLAVLYRNVEDDQRVQVVPKAIGGSHRPVCLAGSSGGVHVTSDPDDASHAVVKQTTLPALLDEYDVPYVDLLKIDIEGAEYDTLFACDERLLRTVRRIVMETHDAGTCPWVRYAHTDLVEYLTDALFHVEYVAHPTMACGFLYADRR
jgi:FkbM family methyltransferase